MIRILAAAVSACCLTILAVVVLIRREVRKAAGEIIRYRSGERNARLRTKFGILSDLWSAVNSVLEDAQTVEAESKRTRRRMKDLLAGISHDIRTPLTSSIGYLQALKDGVPSSRDEELEFIGIILSKTEGIRDYSESLFRLARLEADELSPGLKPVDVAEILRCSILSFSPFLESDGFTVNVSINDRKCMINGDEASLLRIFQNLIGNAVRHGKAGKHLGISLERGDGRFLVSMEDHGPGISPEHITRILSCDPGNRPDVRTGEGLGLFITKKLTESLGGFLSIESEPGKRTVVTVEFPGCET